MRDGRVIAILCGGGLTHASGGIGRLTSYLLDEWATQDACATQDTCATHDGELRRVVIDTRGGGGRVAGAARFAWAGARLALMLAGGRIGLVHANMSTRGSAWRKGALCRLAQLAGVPTVVHLHGADFDAYRAALPRRLRELLDGTLRRATRVIVLGRRWQELLVGEAGLSPERVVVVPNGVPAPCEASTPGGGEPSIVMLGRMGERKGVPELLAALAGPVLRQRSWRATLAGDGEVVRFNDMVTELGLAGRVVLPGWLDGPASAALLSGAAIFVLPSRHEGMAMAVIEALAHGVAVVATPVGAHPEFLVDEHNALLVPAGDAACLAAAIGRLLDDPALRRRIAAAGRATFDERLSIGVAARRIASVHRDAWVVSKRRRRGRSSSAA